MTEGHEDYLGDLWDLLPTDPTDFIEDTPTEDESEKAPSSEWAFDHNADVSRHHTKFTNTEHDLVARHPLAVLDPLICSEAEAAGLINDHRLLPAAHHIKYTDANARTAISNIFGADGLADSDIDLDSHALLNPTNIPTKTTAAWSKTIGATGDYATFAAAMAAIPDLLAHDTTLTVEIGTILTEQCAIQNKHALVAGIDLFFAAERYYPTAGALPTADSATVTTLRDVSVFTVDDYFNDCWVFIVDGTGTDNGYVKITDTDGTNGDIIVAAWPGTQPDNTSKYLIVGALIEGGGTIFYNIFITNCTARIDVRGIGCKNATGQSIATQAVSYVDMRYNGIFDADQDGLYVLNSIYLRFRYGGIVLCNTDNNAAFAGIRNLASAELYLGGNGISDNNQNGVLTELGGFTLLATNFGNGNALYGSYARNSGQAYHTGTECTGASGDHSNGVGDGSLAY